MTAQSGLHNSKDYTAGATGQPTANYFVKRICAGAAGFDRTGMGLLRLGLVIVLFWIGGLKFANYEADSIVPLVATGLKTARSARVGRVRQADAGK